jgi:hypothetical protein
MRATGVLNKAGSRRKYWRDLIRQQARSGQSVSVFCSERGLTEQSLYAWRKRLSREVPVSFALVKADQSKSKDDAPLELDLGSGQLLRIPCGVDATTLRTVLAVLRERP